MHPITTPPEPEFELWSFDHLHEITYTLDDFVADDPIAALELLLSIGADADRVQLPRQIAELVSSWSDREIALGGDGLVLDREESSVDPTGLRLVLHALDARRSKVRLEQLADEISEECSVPPLMHPLAHDATLIDHVVRALEQVVPPASGMAPMKPFASVRATILVECGPQRGTRRDRVHLNH